MTPAELFCEAVKLIYEANRRGMENGWGPNVFAVMDEKRLYPVERLQVSVRGTGHAILLIRIHRSDSVKVTLPRVK